MYVLALSKQQWYFFIYYYYFIYLLSGLSRFEIYGTGYQLHLDLVPIKMTNSYPSKEYYVGTIFVAFFCKVSMLVFPLQISFPCFQ